MNDPNIGAREMTPLERLQQEAREAIETNTPDFFDPFTKSDLVALWGQSDQVIARAYADGGEATYQRFVEISDELEYGKDDICFGCIQTIKARLRPSPTPTEN